MLLLMVLGAICPLWVAAAIPIRGCRRRVAILYGGGIFACRHRVHTAHSSNKVSVIFRHRGNQSDIGVSHQTLVLGSWQGSQGNTAMCYLRKRDEKIQNDSH